MRTIAKLKIDGGNIRQSHQAIWSMAYITHNFCCIEVRRVKVQAFLFQISCKEWAFTLQGSSTLIVALLVELCKSKPSKKWLYTIHSRETSTRGDVWTNWLIAWCPQPRELLSLNLRNKNTPPPLATKPNSLKSFLYTKTVTSFSIGHLFSVTMNMATFWIFWNLGAI